MAALDFTLAGLVAPLKPAAVMAEVIRAFQPDAKLRAEEGGWNVSETARRVGLARSHLNDLIKAHGLSRGRRG